jgi:hypothetical protein
MGAVYSALHEGLQRPVALKTLLDLSLDPTDQERFAQEARTLAQIVHPNVVPVFDVGSIGSMRYLIMEHVDGESLAQRLQASGAMPPPEAARLALGIALGVGAAHEQRILHRDVKPANVLLGQDGVPRLTDFGLARHESDQRLTASGVVVGTPHYMAPEQALGEFERLGPPADVYGVGAVLYEMLSGHPPHHEAGGVLATLSATIEGPPTPPSHYTPDTPRDLEAICLRCLETDPDRRYVDANALAVDLSSFLAGETVEARLPSPLSRALRRVQRQGSTIALTAVLTLAVCMLGVLAAIPLVRARSLSALEASAANHLAQHLAELTELPDDAPGLEARLEDLAPLPLREDAYRALDAKGGDRRLAVDRGLGNDEALERAAGALAARVSLRLATLAATPAARYGSWARAWVQDPTGPPGREAALSLALALRAQGDAVARPLAKSLFEELADAKDAIGRRALCASALTRVEAFDFTGAAGLFAAAGGEDEPLARRLASALALERLLPGSLLGSAPGQRGEGPPHVLIHEGQRVTRRPLEAGGVGPTLVGYDLRPRVLRVTLGAVRAKQKHELLIVRQDGKQVVWESQELASPPPEPHEVWRGPAPTKVHRLAFGDLDGDGLQDLVLLGWAGAQQSFALLARDPRPLLLGAVRRPYQFESLTCADLDGDGRDEIVLAPSALDASKPPRVVVLSLEGSQFKARARPPLGPVARVETIRGSQRDRVLLLVDRTPGGGRAPLPGDLPRWLGQEGCYVLRQDGEQAPTLVARWTWGPESGSTSASRFETRNAEASVWELGGTRYVARTRRTPDDMWTWEWVGLDALAWERNVNPELVLRCSRAPPRLPKRVTLASDPSWSSGKRLWTSGPARAWTSTPTENVRARPDRLARALRLLQVLGVDASDPVVSAMVRRLRVEHASAWATRTLARSEVDSALILAQAAEQRALRAFRGLQSDQGRKALLEAQSRYMRAASLAEELAKGGHGWEPDAGGSWAQAAHAWRAGGKTSRALKAARRAADSDQLGPDQRARIGGELRVLERLAAREPLEVNLSDTPHLLVLRPDGVRNQAGGLRLRVGAAVRDALLIPCELRPSLCSLEVDLELEGPCWCSVLRAGLFEVDEEGGLGRVSGVELTQWSVYSRKLGVTPAVCGTRARSGFDWERYRGRLRLRVEFAPTRLGTTRVRWSLSADEGELVFVGEDEVAQSLTANQVPRRLYLGLESASDADDIASFDQGAWPMSNWVRVERIAVQAGDASLGWKNLTQPWPRLWRAHGMLVRGEASDALRAYGALAENPALPSAVRLEAQWWRGLARGRRGDSAGPQDLVDVASQHPDVALRWFENLAEHAPTHASDWRTVLRALGRLSQDRDPLLAALGQSLLGQPRPVDRGWARGEHARTRAALYLQARFPSPALPRLRQELRRELSRMPSRPRAARRLPGSRLPAFVPPPLRPGEDPAMLLRPTRSKLQSYLRASRVQATHPDRARPLLAMAQAALRLKLVGRAARLARSAEPLAKTDADRGRAQWIQLQRSLSLEQRALTLRLLRDLRANPKHGIDLKQLAPIVKGDAELEALLPR